MLDKLQETELLKNDLESKLDDVTKEIEEAKHQRSSLEKSFFDKRQAKFQRLMLT